MKDSMTYEEALNDPSLAHFHDAILFLKENKDTIFFPKKFMAGLKYIVAQDIRETLHDNPDMPPLKLLLTTLTGVNEKIPPEMVLEITAHIMKEWESLTAAAKKENELHPV